MYTWFTLSGYGEVDLMRTIVDVQCTVMIC